MKKERSLKLLAFLLFVICITMAAIIYKIDPVYYIRIQHQNDSLRHSLHRVTINYTLCKNENDILAGQIDNQYGGEDLWKMK